MKRITTLLGIYLIFLIWQLVWTPITFCQENDKIRYVSDVLVINLKDRLDKPYEIVANVQSDDALHLLEENGNYAKVRTEDGKEGWILKQYLKKELPKNQIIKQLRQEISNLKTELNIKLTTTQTLPDSVEKTSNEEQSQAIREKLAETEKQLSKVQEDNTQLRQHSTDLSGTPANLILGGSVTSTENLEFNKENYAFILSELDKRGMQINELQKTIREKDDHTRIVWFGAGALVFLIGLIFGRSRSSRKNKLTF